MRAKNIHLDAHRQEITRKIPGFPVSCYCTTFRSDTYDYIDWHWHVEFELCLTVSGSVLWHTEAEQTEVPAGQGIFINSQRVHMVRPVRKEASFFCLDTSAGFYLSNRTWRSLRTQCSSRTPGIGSSPETHHAANRKGQ